MFVELPAELTGFPAPKAPTPAGLRVHATDRLSDPLALTSAVSVADWPCVREFEEVDKVTHGNPVAQSDGDACPHSAPAASKAGAEPQSSPRMRVQFTPVSAILLRGARRRAPPPR